jgi:membrane protease YdiL (CAAX protease family)
MLKLIVLQITFIFLFLVVCRLLYGDMALINLGITKMKLRFLAASIGVAVALYVIQSYIVSVWVNGFPEQAATAVAIQQKYYAGSSIAERMIAFSLAGVAEELVFRGYLQPRYGIAMTSVAFAALHFQYGFSLIMLFVFAGSLLLGLLRKRTNTTSSALAHVTYNLLLQIF